MSIINGKNNIMNKFGVLNVLSEGLPNFSIRNSFSSINNQNNVVDFLTDLAIILGGYDRIKNEIVLLLSNKLPEIERILKQQLKNEFKSFFNCDTNGGLPDWLKSNSNGVRIKLDNIDFFNQFKVNPNSISGNLLYDDIQSGLNSDDLNTFIYNVISENKNITNPNGGTFFTWKGILQLKFNPTTNNGNNILTIKASPSYDNKSLTDLNNDFINSVSIFGTPNNTNSSKIFTNIIDLLFGSLTSFINKKKNQIKKEVEIEQIIERIINVEDDEIIDDSFFEFNSEQLIRNEELINQRVLGFGYINTCGNQPISISVDDITNIYSNLTSNLVEQSSIVSNTIETISELQSNNVSPEDRINIRANFIVNLIKLLPTSIIKIIISPKLLLLFNINSRLIYGNNIDDLNHIDFLKQNRSIMRNVSKYVLNIIIQLLLTIVIKEITILVSKKVAKDKIETLNSYRTILQSLLPIPSSVINNIKQFN